MIHYECNHFNITYYCKYSAHKIECNQFFISPQSGNGIPFSNIHKKINLTGKKIYFGNYYAIIIRVTTENTVLIEDITYIPTKEIQDCIPHNLYYNVTVDLF